MSFNNNSFRNPFISFGLIGCLLLVCWQPAFGKSLSKKPRTVPLAQAFNLKQGQEVQLQGTKLEIKLLEVNDSRCPRQVTCVWAGNGAVKLDVSVNGKSRQTMTLNTGKTSALPAEQTYGNYKVWLLALNPYLEKGGTSPNEYVATLMISRLRRR
jgi:hypothetical protein